MEKKDNQQPQQTATQQFAMIWNYNAHVEHQNNYYGAEPAKAPAGTPQPKTLTRQELGRAVKQVERLMWGQSAYAVIFCAARDHFGYADNATLFENDIRSMTSRLDFQYPCPPNTIASAFYNNSYLKLHVGKWESRGVKQRSLLLAEAFIKAVEDQKNG